MKTLIVYSSKHGCTEKCTSILKEKMTGKIEVFNIKTTPQMDLSIYSTIIIGGSIHAGQIQKKIKDFCRNNLSILQEKKLGLFICCMEEGQKAEDQFHQAFPADVIKHASATGIFGGEFNFEKMNFIEKSIVKKVAKVEKSVFKISTENIDTFITKMI